MNLNIYILITQKSLYFFQIVYIGHQISIRLTVYMLIFDITFLNKHLWSFQKKRKNKKQRRSSFVWNQDWGKTVTQLNWELNELITYFSDHLSMASVEADKEFHLLKICSLWTSSLVHYQCSVCRAFPLTPQKDGSTEEVLDIHRTDQPAAKMWGSSVKMVGHRITKVLTALRSIF